ncbi:MAG: penicillin-binding protein activator [candidate division Zixibacteria bacterium]|nr:penicillin-binding protein activator [candidate division Zixibacteria bacterium]
MRSLRLRIVVGFLILAAASSIYAENTGDSPEARALYADGKRMMKQGDFFGAARIFEQLSGRFANSDYVDLYVFHRAKAKYYLGEYSDAISSFKYFAAHFENSPELPFVYFYMGNAYYLKGDINRAVLYYFQSYRTSRDRRLNQILISSISEAVRHASSVRFAAGEFESIKADRRCLLAETVARALYEKNDSTYAREILSHCSQPDNTGDVSDYRPSRGEISVAIALPFSGELQKYADQIYNGAIIAAEQIRNEYGIVIDITAVDTKADPIDAASLIAEIAADKTYVAAIGPLTSEEAAVAAASLICSDLPLLIPAATQAGLTGLSETSFQLSPNIELEGAIMAEYAAIYLQADSAAIITSTAAEHLKMSRAFIERFEKLGGTIVAVEYYRPRDKDFGPQIADIKTELLGEFPDSIYYINPGGDTLDLDDIPAHLDCLYLPGSADQIKLLVAQIGFYNLNAAYLGSDGWGDEKVLRLGDNVTKGAVFPSPFLEIENSEANLKFSAAYDIRYGKRPERLAALGYDALKILGMAIKRSGNNRKRLVENLSDLRDFQGASGRISFGKSRENIDMPLYRIENGRAILISAEQSTAELVEPEN